MSALAFLNRTDCIAQFVVDKGDQVVARLPGIAPGASMTVPAADTWSVTAANSFHAVIDGATTGSVQTTNPNATVTAVTETTDFEAGRFTLIVS